MSTAPPASTVPLPDAPVVVSCAGGAPVVAVVRAVIPCFGRARDLDLLLADLAALDRTAADGPVELGILVVDNASPEPLEPVVAGRARVLRLARNTGGSGGFNAGLVEHLRVWREPAAANHFLWLIDSDARLRPNALLELVREMARRPSCVVAGSALADPVTGEVFETGGRVDRRTGELVQPAPVLEAARVEYVAACSMLVRRGAVEAGGVMRDLFLNGDDAEWCLRLARITGGEVVCVPSSVALHPRPDRMRTLARYYGARNAIAYLEGSGARARFMRALREAGRAISQHLVGREDLAELHIRGLRDGAAGRVDGPMTGAPALEPMRPLSELAGAIEAQLPTGARVGVSGEIETPGCVSAVERCGTGRAVVREGRAPRGRWGAGRALRGLGRVITGPAYDGAIVSARARPGDWLLGRTVLIVDDGGFVIRRLSGWTAGLEVAATAVRGLGLAARLAIAPARLAPAARPALPAGSPPGVARVSVVVLSYNRAAALRTTLAALGGAPDTRDAEIIVADNASTDGSVEMVGAEFPRVRVIALEKNVGVAGFNRAVEAARSPYVLILDDDARPAPGAVAGAIGLMERDGTIGGVALHPRHPKGGASEWSFAAAVRGEARRWPVMGCGNLVRRDAWMLVGGYDEDFFLYRNDCDLAMKLLGAGYGVAFDPALVVWHDSPQAARKNERWFELATRNWVLMARKHGRGVSGVAALLAGWAWAHRLAGLRVAAQWLVVRGAVRGLVGAPTPLPPGVTPDGRAMRDLLMLQLGSRAGRGAPPPPPASSSIASSDLHSA